MDKKESIYKDTAQLASAASGIYDQAYLSYSTLIADAMKSKPTQRQAERILDGILDFCYDKRFQVLFKQFCKHIYQFYPDSAVDYIKIYRDQLEEDEQSENDNINL